MIYMSQKRIKTCLRYPGGKFYGYKRFQHFLEIPHEEYREPFVGGASVFLGKKLASKLNWINDKDEELINFYNIIKNDGDRKGLSSLLSNEVANKERHLEVRQFNPKNDVERAFKYFYLNRTSFSGIMNNPRWGYMIGSSVTPDKWPQIIIPVGEKLKNAKITSFDFRKVITSKTKNRSVLIYLDPPYFKASKAIYTHEFKMNDHQDLMKLLKDTKYKFVLSYNDDEELRQMYDWASIYKLDWVYYMSEARREKGKELIITNFKLELF